MGFQKSAEEKTITFFDSIISEPLNLFFFFYKGYLALQRLEERDITPEGRAFPKLLHNSLCPGHSYFFSTMS